MKALFQALVQTRVRRGVTRATWLVPVTLVGLSLVPLLGGLIRLAGILRHEGPPAAADARFVAAPLVTVLHVIAATSFSIVGAFQFSAELRSRAPRWHRIAGRVLAAAGLVAGFTGLWMAVAWDIPPAMQGPLLLGTRVVVGTLMVRALVLSIRAILRGDIAGHEAWMIRAYALGQGAGTQVLLLALGALLLGSGGGGGPTRDVLMTTAWLINAVVGELIIRGAAARSRSPVPVLRLFERAARTAPAP